MNEPADTLRAYGHSWVTGEDASRPELGFVEVAARALGLRPGNHGVGGSAAFDTAALVRDHPPGPAALYVVLTGLNDARRDGASAPALHRYEAALGTIFTALARAGPATPVVAIEQPHLVDYSGYAPHHRGSNEALDAYNDRLRAVAHRYATVTVVPVPDWDAGRMLSADDVHPNDAGHAALARAIVAVRS